MKCRTYMNFTLPAYYTPIILNDYALGKAKKYNRLAMFYIHA